MIIRQMIYDTYWKTAAERQKIFYRKRDGLTPPLTNDPIFQMYKFCNVFRASDRVSQYLISKVIYQKERSAKDTLFRIFLFRLLNKNETWDELENILGEITVNNYDFVNYSRALEKIRESQPIYGNAFILCANKAFGFEKKHQNHLALLDLVFNKSKKFKEIISANSLRGLYEELRELPLIGDFMAYQIATDFNYSEVFDFDENDFTVAGPGAKRGIDKCFVKKEGKSYEEIIMMMVNGQDKEFERLGIDFKNLFGRKMTAIDCQGWFCETDKYCRVSFPELKSNRQKIKNSFKGGGSKIDYFYPPKWKLKIE